MLAMVGLLCLVFVAMKLAARPESWHWLLPPDGSSEIGEPNDPTRLRELDFRVKVAAEDSLPAGTFRAVGSNEDPPPEHPAGVSADADKVGTSISGSLLKGIEDNTIGVRSAERVAYLEMLQRIRQLPDRVKEAEADDDVAFTVIMLDSDTYRGKLVSVVGWMRRLTEFPVLENDRGIDQLYEGWLFTNDSGTNPWRFLCTELPANTPRGESFEPIKVRVTGYFFKRSGYASHGGQHVAPTLLAESFELLRTPVNPTPQMQQELQHWMLGIVGLVVLGLAVLVWWFSASDKRFATSHLQELAASRLDADSDNLRHLESIEIDDSATLFETPTQPPADT